jgi:hypothetical protein
MLRAPGPRARNGPLRRRGSQHVDMLTTMLPRGWRRRRRRKRSSPRIRRTDEQHGLRAADELSGSSDAAQANRCPRETRADEAAVLFAEGASTGIMTESGMLRVMATSAAARPHALAPHLRFCRGLILPGPDIDAASLLFDTDSFYFGVLPALAERAEPSGSRRSRWRRFRCSAR